ncbi:hypothetical protein F511_00927 [Dorcoceras hygrometricum]|nr:hypothetical protein F511_00927 [Dorcoceras hygrometricum]
MSGLELVTSWLTPTVLFCLLNLMIGIVFVISGRSNPPKSRSEDDAVSPPQLARVPSLFERVNSIKRSFSRSENPSHPVPVPTAAHDGVPMNQDQSHQSPPEGNESHVTRSKSDTKANASAPAAEEEEEEGGKISEQRGDDEAVDARADDFINRFRQQLKMQRVDSLLRYKEMLKRGGR